MKEIYKVQRLDNKQWMQSGGQWTDKEENGKVWKRLNHVKNAITNAKYEIAHNYRKKFTEPFPSVEIVVYDIKESRRIKP